VDFVEQLKSSIDIVRVIGEWVRLKRVGSTGRYQGLCPFHQEKTPSFSVNQSRQFYKCFGCGVGGDALKFVQEIEGLTFPETLKFLSERYGIPMPKRTEFADAESKLRGALMDMHAIAAQMFQANLRSDQGSAAREYLARRGVTPELIETFQLGFSDPSGQGLVRRLSAEHYTPEQMEASGLVRKRPEGGHYDNFRGRLMFPIHNESGKVIGFGGRAMRDGDEPKYLNSPETAIYRKTSVLYNLHRARQGMRDKDRAVLVEGYMDVIGVYSAGVKEVVASCGTSLTNAQVRSIHRHTDTVLVNFDPDNAGANAAERAIQLFLDEGIRIRIVSLDQGLDPDEYVKKYGVDAYGEKLNSAAGYFHWLADRARLKFDMKSAEGRVDAFKFLLPSVQKIHDKLERAAIANDLAGYLGVEQGVVLDEFRKAPNTMPARAANGAKPQKRASIPEIEKILLHALVSSSEARSQVLPRLTEDLTGRLILRNLFETIRTMQNAEATIDFAALESRLSEAGQTLLHEVFAADETVEESALMDQALSCVRRLEMDFEKVQIDALRTRIREAEREGRMEDAIRLMSELIQRQKKSRVTE
jgi:DNA primase